jgi:hypothetical protein
LRSFQHFARHRVSQASRRDVGEAIPSFSLRPHADRVSNLGRPIPVCPSCGGHALTAERTMTRQMPDTRELTESFDTKAAIRELAHYRISSFLLS